MSSTVPKTSQSLLFRLNKYNNRINHREPRIWTNSGCFSNIIVLNYQLEYLENEIIFMIFDKSRMRERERERVDKGIHLFEQY